MAYVSNYLTQAIAATTAVTLPPHEVDDIIVVAVSGDGGGTLSFTWGGNSTGGAQVGTTQVSTTLLCAAVSTAKATGDAATCTVTMGTADSMWVHMFILKDCDTTTWLDASNATVAAAALEITTASVTTTTADCLLLYYLAVDNATAAVPEAAHSRPGPTATMHFIDSSDNGGTTTTTTAIGAAGWYYKRTAGATTQPVWDISASTVTASFVMAFRNKSGGKIPAYVDDSAENGRQLFTGTWWASATTRNNQNYKATPLTYTRVSSQHASTAASGTGTLATLTFATQPFAPFPVGYPITVAGVTPAGYNATATVTACTTSTVTYKNTTTGAQTVAGTITSLASAAFDAGAAVADAGFNPYAYAVNSTPATSTTAPTGFEVGFPTTAHDMTTGWVIGGFHASTNKMAGFNQGSIAQGGTFLTIGQGASNYRTYQVMGRNNQDGYGKDFAIISVQANQTQTAFGSSTTQPTISTIDKLLITHRGHNATGAFYYTDWHLFKRLILAGGDTNYPVDSQGVSDIARFCRIPVVKKLGAAELTAYVPIQVGGGDAINFQIDAGAFQFPRIYDRTKKEINYHGADGAIGISYAGKSGDVIKHTNSVVTSASPYYWEINAAATSAATWDFTGLTVVKANVTLRPVVTFENMTFSNCAYIDTTGSTVQNCKFGNSLVRATSPANAALVSLSAFTKTSGTQHGMEITGTAANFTLNGVTFTGYAGTNGSTGNEAIYVNIASGSVTINITGGGSTPSIRTAGATVTVQNAVTVTVTVLDSSTLSPIQNARVLLEKVSDGTDILPPTSLTNASGVVTTSYAYTTDTAVTGAVRRASAAYGTLYKPNAISGTITSGGLDVTILLTSDE